MAEIILTNGLSVLVDEADVGILAGTRWYFMPPTSRIGTGYAYSPGDGKTVWMHRLILDASPHQEVDHINRNSLDNRRENLRLATRSQQCANAASAPNASGFRGIHMFHGRRKPFRAELQCMGIRYRGPYRHDAHLAAGDYDELAVRHFGEFAILNFPARQS